MKSLTTMLRVGAVLVTLPLVACGPITEKMGDVDSQSPSTSQSSPVVEDSASPDTQGSDSTDSSETPHHDGAHQVHVSVPDDWREVSPEDFVYHYVWKGNDWDDALAQYFTDSEFEMDADKFIEILRPNVEENIGSSGITLTERKGGMEIGGYHAIVIDMQSPDASTVTSFSYVNVDGTLWEFTANAQTEEGLAKAEAINQSAVFKK